MGVAAIGRRLLFLRFPVWFVRFSVGRRFRKTRLYGDRPQSRAYCLGGCLEQVVIFFPSGCCRLFFVLVSSLFGHDVTP